MTPARATPQRFEVLLIGCGCVESGILSSWRWALDGQAGTQVDLSGLFQFFVVVLPPHTSISSAISGIKFRPSQAAVHLLTR